MRLLLDTHVWLWMLVAPERLNEAARAAVADANNEAFVSIASVWEAGIKHALGKLPLPMPLRSLVTVSVDQFKIKILPIGLEHALISPTLPQHHKDPFDRVLIAQAQVDALTLVTRDPAIRLYACPILWAA